MIKSYKDYLTEAEQSLGPQPGDYLHLVTEEGVTNIQLTENPASFLVKQGVKDPKGLSELLKIPLDKAKKLWKKLGFGAGAGAGAIVSGGLAGGGNNAGNAFKVGYDLASNQFVGSNPLIEHLNKDIQTNYPQNISHFVIDLL